MALGQTLNLTCNFTGLPHPWIRWYKDGTELNVLLDTRLDLLENNRTLQVNNITTKDEGTYRCVGENRYKEAYEETILTVTGKYNYKLTLNPKIHGVVINF